MQSSSVASAVAATLRLYGLAILDVVFPRICAVCDEPLDDADQGAVCRACWSEAEEVAGPLCVTCGQPLRDPPRGRARCVACPQGDVHFDRAWSAVLYQGPVVAAIHDYKFGYRTANHLPLSRRLIQAFHVHCAHLPIDYVTPVPLHPAREREREFNQSALLAAALCRETRLMYAPELLRRARYTRPQSSLRGAARLTNVHDAFAAPCPEKTRDAVILLIDDVYTSGTTVNECARVLKLAGAARVLVLTAARAV